MTLLHDLLVQECSCTEDVFDISQGCLEISSWDGLLRFSQSAVFVYATSENLPLLYVSPNLAEVAGFSGKEVLADPLLWEQGIQAEVRASRQAGLRQAALGTSYIGEYLLCRPDGTQVWLRESLRPDVDDRGIVRRILGSVTDISEVREAQAKAAEVTARYHRAFELAGLPAAMIGEDGCIIEANRAMAAWLGYTVEDMRGMPVCRISHPGDVAENQRLRDQLWNGLVERFRMEKRYLHKDGTVLRGLLLNAIVRDDQGKPLYSVAHIQDITVQRQAEETARMAHERLLDAISALPDSFALFDADERLVLCNESYRRLPEIGSACLPGTHVEEVLTALVRSNTPNSGSGSAEEFVREHLQSFRAARGVPSLALSGGRWLRLAEKRTRDGGTVVVASDVTDLKRAEVALRDSEERFRLLVEGSALGVIVTSNGRILFANRRMAEMLGYSSTAEFLALGRSEAFKAPHEVERLRGYREARARGAPAPLCYEYQALCKDGSYLWVENQAAVISWRGEHAILSSVIDIGERKRIDAAQRKSEAVFRGTFEHSPFPAAIADEDGFYQYVNRALCELVGYSQAELLGSSASIMTHPDDRAAARTRLMNNATEEASSYSVRKRYVHKDGTVIWVIASVSTLRDETGRVFGSVRQVQDITEEVKADQARRDMEQQLRAVVDNSPSGICIREPQGPILMVNRSYAERFGLFPEQMVGRLTREFYPPAQAEGIDNTDAAIVATGRPATREVTQKFADGEIHTVLSVKFPIGDVMGQTVAIGVISSDMTDYKNVEERLHQAQKMEAVGQLTGGIAHDFNNLLNVILGNLELIEAAVGDDPEIAKRLRNADIAVHRGAELTDRLLAFSRRKSLRPQVVDVNQLIEDVAELLSRTLGEDIKIETILDPSVPSVQIDPGQLENAILNLSLNSRDALEPGGRLVIETRAYTVNDDSGKDLPPGSYVFLTVSDNGTGMTPEVRDRAFEPFFTTKDVGKGSGLGLSMVYGFVTQSGGHIDIESQLGVGTTVRILLPGVSGDKAAEPAVTKQGSVVRGSHETILVVEDDQELRRIAFELLTDLEYKVLTAEDGPSALAIVASEERIDLLFVDMVLPHGMNGAELARQARVRRPDLKVVFTSGYPDEVLRRQSSLEQGQLLVGKPYRMHEVAQTIRRALDNKQLSFPLESA